MPMSDTPNLDAALFRARVEFPAIVKGQENDFFHSKYASLSDVMDAIEPILRDHELAVRQSVQFDTADGMVFDVLETCLFHISGEYVITRMRLLLAKPDPQAQGSAITYARRYSYMTILGLVAEDDDGNAASSRSTAKKTPRGSQKPEEDQTHSENPFSPLQLEVKNDKTIKSMEAGDRTEFFSDAIGYEYPGFRGLTDEDCEKILAKVRSRVAGA
jgi:hypothetical protein